jgi:2-methylcitrate dehydratase PrpD
MAHARDYDDTHDAAVLHAGVSVVPAALAAAEMAGGVSGKDFITAVAVGLETICRLGVATRIGVIESGFIYTSLFGYFGATVAAGRVLGLSQTQMVDAIGIAYSQAAGTHQVTRDGALTKRMQPGFAAKAALVSVQLAQSGVLGAQNTFAGVDGLFRTYLRDQWDPAVLLDGLGEHFLLTGLSYKPYPCCRFTHTAIDAALEAQNTHKIDPKQILRIEARVTRQSFEAVCTPVEIRKAPKTIVQAQFSIPYCVATAIVDGSATLANFTDEALTRPEILNLAARVEAVVDAELEREFGRSISPTRLVIETADGKVLEVQANVPRGHPENPMDRTAFDAKLADCVRYSAVPLLPGTSAAFRELIDKLEMAPNTAALSEIFYNHGDHSWGGPPGSPEEGGDRFVATIGQVET